MCLNPTYGVNPALRSKASFYDTAYLNGDIVSLGSNINPFSVFNLHTSVGKKRHKHLCLDPSAIDKYFLVNSSTGDTIPLYTAFPCGYCDDCIRSKYFELNSRLQIESAYSKHRVIFGTLTYSDEFLPNGRSLSKSDVSDFIHKLYTYAPRFGFSTDFRFFLVGEYGSKYGRPHYHYLLFDFELKPSKYKDFSNMIRLCWNRCSVYDWQFAKKSNRSLTGYVTKYVSKFLKYTSLAKTYPKDIDWSTVPMACPRPNQVKPFWRGSRSNGGIGSPILHDQTVLDNIINSPDGKITLKSKTFKESVKINVPKFILDKIFPYASRILSSDLKRCLDYFGRLWTALYSYNFTMVNIPRDFDKKFNHAFLDCRTPIARPQMRVSSLDSPHRINLGPFDLMVNSDNFDYLFDICNTLSVYLDSLPDLSSDIVHYEIQRRRWMSRVSQKSMLKNNNRFDKLSEISTFVSKSMQTASIDAKFNL